MSSIEEMTPFDGLKAENQRLENELNFANKCLDVLLEIKINLNRVLDQTSVSSVISLTSEDIQIFNRLEEKYKQILEENDSNKDKEYNHGLNQLTEESSVVISSNINQFVANKPINGISYQKEDIHQKSGSQPVIAFIYPNSSSENPIISSKKSHSSRVRSKVREPEGDECVVVFKSGSNSKFKDKQRFNCNIINCYQEFKSRPRLVMHQKECHKDYFPFKCSHESCDRIFRLESKLKRHIEGVHNRKPLKCRAKDCDYESETMISLMTHQKECHKDLFPFQCVLESCESSFRKKTELIRHLLEVHKKRIKCPTNGCDYETNQRIELRVHQQKCHKKFVKQFECNYESCGSSFHNNSRLQRHIIEVHMNERRYFCSQADCGKGFKTKNALNAHQIIHSNETPFKCEFQGCAHSAKSMHRLKLHQKVHSNDRPFVCEFERCNERFKTKLTLQSHMNIHSDEEPIPCPLEDCGKFFKPHLLRVHISMHSKELLTCDWPGCKFTTKGMNRLRAHHKFSHSEERNFVCNWNNCQKRFKTNFQLRNHYRMHTNDKPYGCQWPGCEYRSSYSANIRIHSRIHKNEKPFSCEWPGCEYRCSIAGNLKKHMKIHEKN